MKYTIEEVNKFRAYVRETCFQNEEWCSERCPFYQTNRGNGLGKGCCFELTPVFWSEDIKGGKNEVPIKRESD